MSVVVQVAVGAFWCGFCSEGHTHERTCVARAPKTEALRASEVRGDGGWADEGVAIDSVVVEGRLEDSADRRRRSESVVSCCLGVVIGSEGFGMAGCGTDMHNVGRRGRWEGRKSFGGHNA